MFKGLRRGREDFPIHPKAFKHFCFLQKPEMIIYGISLRPKKVSQAQLWSPLEGLTLWVQALQIVTDRPMGPKSADTAGQPVYAFKESEFILYF